VGFGDRFESQVSAREVTWAQKALDLFGVTVISLLNKDLEIIEKSQLHRVSK
jgi:hypothetical protein